MKSNQEIWIDFVKRVLKTGRDLPSVAERLHKGHSLIFGSRRYQCNLETTDRTQKAIWTACLKCAEQSLDPVDDVAARLMKAHDVIFKNKND